MLVGLAGADGCRIDQQGRKIDECSRQVIVKKGASLIERKAMGKVWQWRDKIRMFKD